MPLGANKVALYGASADTGSAVLLSTATASSDASIEFTLPTAYKQVVFSWYSILPATDDDDFKMNVSSDGGSTWVTKTSSFFAANHTEADDNAVLQYEGSDDLAQSTSDQTISRNVGSASDEGCAGTMQLYSPSSTTYVKHWTSRSSGYGGGGSPRAWDNFGGGYANTTSSLNKIRFLFSSGNISSGTIKMWGVS
tara:strand:+ start:861 stop:1445 length:585 start_codon:yes stop_codon:yes gene_type:complete